jgi:hypothetical protein
LRFGVAETEEGEAPGEAAELISGNMAKETLPLRFIVPGI